MESVLEAVPTTTSAPQALAIVPAQTATPADLLRIAMQQDDKDMDRLERLMAMQERWEAAEARKAYVAAMTAFKAKPPVVFKDKLVAFGDTSYKHATLADIVDAVCKGLSQHGLSHRWEVKQDGGAITVTCIITHAMGHSESVSMTSLPDNSGKKNAIQSVASAVTYLQRYTLQSLTGIAAQDRNEDDDGRGSEVATITEEEQAALRDRIEATGSDLAKFLDFFKVSVLSEIPSTRYTEAVTILARKERQRAKA